MKFRILSKCFLLLVVIGFFMPVSCNMNGFDIGNAFIGNNSSGIGLDMFIGIAVYLIFFAAIASMIISVIYILAKKKNPPLTADWILLLVSIGSGLIAFFKSIDEVSLEYGAYFILAGWILSLLCLIISSLKSGAKSK